jgi:hypothetical protein
VHSVSLEAAQALADWSYEQAKEEAESSVVRWEWASFTRYSLEPCYFEINRYRRGDPLSEEPDPPLNGARGHGFDAAGCLRVERQQTNEPGSYYETFYATRPGGTARRHFDHLPSKHEINSSFFEQEGEQVSRIDTVYRGGKQLSETFSYDSEGRLITIERRGSGDVHEFRDVEWDELGLVRVFRRWPNGKRALEFEKPRPGQTLAQRGELLSAGLTKAIRMAIEQRGHGAPICALALWWRTADYQVRFPPHVALLSSEKREAVLARNQAGAPGIWNPSEWSELQLELGPELTLMCQLISKDVWLNALQEEASALLRVTAKALSELPEATTSDEFVAYAIAVDGASSPAEQLKTQLAPALRSKLEERGLL